MENILYLNAILPYVYLTTIFTMSKNSGLWEELSGSIYIGCGIAIIIQIFITLIISLLSRNKKKLAEVNFLVKLIQIPYYILYFITAAALFLILMGLMGIGLLFLPLLIAIDAAVFATTVIPAEICTIKLALENKISAGKLILFLIFNTWYCVDIFTAFKIKKEYNSAL